MSSDDNIFKRESPWGSPPGGGNDNGNGSGSGQRRQPPNIDDILGKHKVLLEEFFQVDE